MFRSSVFAFATVTLMVSSFPPSVDAHSWMTLPKPTFPDLFYQPMSPYAVIDGESFAGAKDIASYKGAEKAAKAITTSGAKTLRQFMMTNMNITMTDMVKMPTKECGMTQADGARQPIVETIEWGWAHPGPCEFWCDNTRLFYNADCAGNKVGNVKIDTSKCAGANFLQGMYLGVHVPTWQVYVNCVPLVGGTSTNAAAVLKADASGEGVAGDSDAPASSTAPSPSASSAPSSAPTSAPSTAPSSAPSSAPARPASSAPAPTSAKPTTKPSCTKRRRRN